MEKNDSTSDIARNIKLFPALVGFRKNAAKMVFLAGTVGLIAGLCAVAFQVISHYVMYYGLEWIAGYHASGAANEFSFTEGAEPLFGRFVPWLILIVITLGGLVSGLLVFLIAPEAEGHGTDAAIKAYHRAKGWIRLRVPLVKIIASAITLGTGGSGGREGPIALIGAGCGSFLGTKLGLSEKHRRMLLIAGIGAGIAAIFRAPLAGAIFAIEVLYRDDDLEAEGLIHAFISCTVAYCVFGLFAKYAFGLTTGFTDLFNVLPGLKFENASLLIPLTALAVVMSLASLLYVRSFYGTKKFFDRLPVKRHFRPAIGAFATGLVALGAYYAFVSFGPAAQKDSLSVLSFGYGILQKLFSGDWSYAPQTMIVILLVIGFGKIITTSLTIGSGGSGGVFGPSMVIGGTLGGVVGIVFQMIMPETVTRIDVFVILGMAGFFSAAAKTPISTIIMVSELTGSYEMLVPAMWVSALAYLLSRRWTIYSEQVSCRLESPAHKSEFIIDVLAGSTVKSIWKESDPKLITLLQNTSLLKVMEIVPASTQEVFPVVNKEGKYMGLFGLSDLRRYLFDKNLPLIAVAQDLAVTDIPPIHLDTDLSVVISRFAQINYGEIPIVNPQTSQVLGVIRRTDILAAYDKKLCEMITSRPG